jgi:hypothetical protein
MSWDPGLANNSSHLFDARRAEVRLPPGVTNESFPQYLIDNLVRFGIWNLYGTHDAKFETSMPNPTDNTRVVSGRTAAAGPLVESDPLLGKPLSLRGKLVDLDPEAVWNSQIFFDRFQLGDGTLGFTASRFQAMHSRWINFRRNLDRLDIAGSAGAIWQTVFPWDAIQYVGVEHSPLLAALKEASEASNAEGLMLRFATYRTLYFQNGLMNSQVHRPRDTEELQRLHSEGKFFNNPAYSKLVGTVGVWNGNEPSSWPGGRYLVPSGVFPPLSVGGRPVSLGPAVAEFDEASGNLFIDFLHAIPELNRNLDKPNLGELQVAVRLGADLTVLGKIDPDSYGRTVYEREAGIITIPLTVTNKILNKLERGELMIVGVSAGESIVLLEEEPLITVVENRDHYVNTGQVAPILVRTYDRGKPPRQPVKVIAGRYLGLQKTDEESIETIVGSDGIAIFDLPAGEAGVADFGMRLVTASAASSELPQRLDITASQFFSVRVLPTDESLEAITSDEDLTWEFIYDRILKNWDLLNPIMTIRGLPLNDEETLRAVGDRIHEVIQLSMHESPDYMPITRDLSIGKRRLLERWLASI